MGQFLNASRKLFDAMEAGDWEKVKELVATTSWTRVDLEKKHGDEEEEEDTLLIRAARSGKEDVIHLLLKAGAAIQATDKCGNTALNIAAQEGHRSALQILLDKGAAIETNNIYGWTPLLAAAFNGHSEVVALLVDRGANIHTQDGLTALYLAAQKGRLQAAEILLTRGADTEARTRLLPMVTPLLIGRGANIYAQAECGDTALSWAAMHKGRKAFEEIRTAIHHEADWRRVKNFVRFLHTGGLSSTDWSVRRLGGGGCGSMSATIDSTFAHHQPPPSSPAGVTTLLIGRQQSKVLENRDLCRIVASFLPILKLS